MILICVNAEGVRVPDGSEPKLLLGDRREEI